MKLHWILIGIIFFFDTFLHNVRYLCCFSFRDQPFSSYMRSKHSVLARSTVVCRLMAGNATKSSWHEIVLICCCYLFFFIHFFLIFLFVPCARVSMNYSSNSPWLVITKKPFVWNAFVCLLHYYSWTVLTSSFTTLPKLDINHSKLVECSNIVHFLNDIISLSKYWSWNLFNAYVQYLLFIYLIFVAQELNNAQ